MCVKLSAMRAWWGVLVAVLAVTAGCAAPHANGAPATGAPGATGANAEPANAEPANAEPANAAPTAPDGCPLGEQPKRQLRGTWIASVSNINWPSRIGLTPAQQQAEYRTLLDKAQALRLNAVFVQIRPAADAFWPSPFEPWSQYLTGTQGNHPGYDPLAFLVAETHARNIELHGWFNPYRVSTQWDVTRLADNHPARQHPTWVERYDGKLFYNPGVPEARQHTVNSIMDAVTRYDIDGVHFDDYFYPYPVSGQTFDDAAEFQRHGAGRSLADWRRSNVDTMVTETRDRIRAAKPHVRFGISPFGIWRNASTDPLGSATSGLQSYDAIYADTRGWVRKGLVDYIAPQLYWTIGFAPAAYDVLVPWWSQVVSGTGVQLYLGQAAYRIEVWDDATEMPDHLVLNRQHPQVRGDIYFSVKELVANPLGFADRLRTDFYRYPALPAAAGTAPAQPTGLTATRTAAGTELAWSPTGATYYAVYRADGAGCGIHAARNLLGTTRGTRFIDSRPAPVGRTMYYVTALSRRHAESPPAGVPVG